MLSQRSRANNVCDCFASPISFTQKVPNLDLTIYEKEDGIGGTWYVNRYPVSQPKPEPWTNVTHPDYGIFIFLGGGL